MVGISFADTTEAWTFKEALDSKLEAKRQRRNGNSLFVHQAIIYVIFCGLLYNNISLLFLL